MKIIIKKKILCFVVGDAKCRDGTGKIHMHVEVDFPPLYFCLHLKLPLFRPGQMIAWQ